LTGRFPVLVLLAACSSSTPSSKPGPASGSAPASEADSGTFVAYDGDKVLGTETFSITPRGANLVLRAKVVAAKNPEHNSAEGELELDAKLRPVRARYRVVTPADGFTYTIGGTPLALDITRDDGRDPQHIAAKGPVDVYVAGPGFAAMTPLCTLVTGDALFGTLGDKQAMSTRFVEAYRGAPVGALQRIVVDAADRDFELLCDGARLVAGAFAESDFWYARQGREADLAALKAAPRPTAHAWKHPADESLPWDPLHTFLFPAEGIIVTRDRRERVNRLTAFGLTDGKEVVHRDFTVPLASHVMCLQMSKGRLACANAPTKYLQIIDARTLADQVDLAPAVAGVPGIGADWHLDQADDKQLVLSDYEHHIVIDLATRKATVIEIPETRGGLRDPGPNDCWRTLTSPLVVGDAEWTIDTLGGTAKLVRTKKKSGKAEPPLELAFENPSLLVCKPKAGAAYILSSMEDKSVLGVLAADGSVRWKTALGAHPSDVYVTGDKIVVTTADEPRRVIAVDAMTGKIIWVASGPVPVP
jgi:hypothetical protein